MDIACEDDLLRCMEIVVGKCTVGNEFLIQDLDIFIKNGGATTEDCSHDERMIQLLTQMLQQKSVSPDVAYLIHSWGKLEDFQDAIIKFVQSPQWVDDEMMLAENNWYLSLILKCYTQWGHWVVSRLVTEVKDVLEGPQMVHMRTHNVAEQVTNIIAEGGKRQVTVTWTPPRKPPKTYKVSLFENEKLIDKNTVEMTSHTFSSLKSNTSYRCQVRSIYEAGPADGAFSKSVKTEPRVLDVLDNGSDFGRVREIVHRVVEVGGGSKDHDIKVLLSWNPPLMSKNYNVVGYRVFAQEKNTNNMDLERVLASSKTELHYLAEAGCKYSLSIVTVIRDLDTLEERKYSSHYTFATAFGAPKKLKLIDNPDQLSTSLIVQFLHAEGKVVEYIGVLVECHQDMTKVRGPEKLQSGFIYTDLKPNTKYLVQVHARFSNGSGPVRSKKAITAPGKAVVETVRRQANFPSTDIEICWQKQQGCTSYEVAISAKDQSEPECLNRCTETTCLYHCQNPGSSYHVYVVAVRDSVRGERSEIHSITLEPEPPTNLTVTPCKNSRGLQVNFQDTSNLGKQYEICAWTTSNPEICQKMVISHSTHIVKDLLAGETYHVSITGIVNDIRSRTVQYPKAVQTYPAQIRKLEAEFASGNIFFKWDPLEIAPNEYRVEWSCNHGSVTKERTQEPRFRLSFIQPAHVYKLRVTGFNSAGCGIKSEWLTFLTEPHSVRKIRAGPSTEKLRSLYVTFDSSPGDQNIYLVKAREMNGTEEKLVRTRENHALIEDVDLNGTYDITVQTDFQGKTSQLTYFLYEGEKMHSEQQGNTSKSERRGDHEATTLSAPMQLPSNRGNLQYITDKKNGTRTFYLPKNRLRQKSSVFATTRPYAGGTEEVILKIIGGISERNKAEVDNLKDVTRHENVVTYYSSGLCDDDGEESIYILMEKCDKETLWERVRSGKIANSGDYAKDYQVRKLAVRGIGKGVQFIHQCCIVHRDLKPHNILFKNGVPVISDFGLSKKLPDAKSNIPQSVKNVGTDGWRAPETGDNTPITTKASDIYSYGLVSHYMLTKGKHPYGENSRKWHTYIDDDVDGTRMSLDALDGLPDENLAKDWIGNMLERNPEVRPAIEEALSHPFLWDDTRKLQFITDACKYLELVEILKKTDAGTGGRMPIYLSLDDKIGTYAEKDMTDWKKYLDFSDEEHREFKNKAGCDVEVNYMKTKVNKKMGNCVSGLSRFVRNRYAHDHEDKAEKVDMTNEELWAFFNKRYPFLLLFVYYKMKVYFAGKCLNDNDFSDTIAKYFNQ